MEVANSGQRALAEQLRSLGISESYASLLARDRRKPSKPLAIHIYREIGVKLGPIAEADDADIDALERIVGRGRAA